MHNIVSRAHDKIFRAYDIISRAHDTLSPAHNLLYRAHEIICRAHDIIFSEKNLKYFKSKYTTVVNRFLFHEKNGKKESDLAQCRIEFQQQFANETRHHCVRYDKDIHNIIKRTCFPVNNWL